MALTLNKNLFKAVQESNESPHGIPGALNHPLLEFYSTSVPLSSVHTLFRNAVISNKQCLTGPPSPCPSRQVILSGHQSSSTTMSSHCIKKDAFFYLPLAYSSPLTQGLETQINLIKKGSTEPAVNWREWWMGFYFNRLWMQTGLHHFLLGLDHHIEK